MRSNFNLFFYGVGGLFLQLIGIVGILGTIFISLIAQELYIFIIGMIIFLGLFIWGKAIRFDYQRQSGHIMHRGDW
jgi:hypothetical protein